VSGEPEVAHVGVLALARLGDEDVRRLHIAVNETGRVGGVVERVRPRRLDLE
jgi:hypothetical protein